MYPSLDASEDNVGVGVCVLESIETQLTRLIEGYEFPVNRSTAREGALECCNHWGVCGRSHFLAVKVNARRVCLESAAHGKAWVFPWERMTPLAKENVWRRSIAPQLKRAGLEWVKFQTMRRTHASLMNDLGVEGKLVADQLGHSLDVTQNVYTQSAISKRQAAVNQLEISLNEVQPEFTSVESVPGRPGSNRRHSAWEAEIELQTQNIANSGTSF